MVSSLNEAAQSKAGILTATKKNRVHVWIQNKRAGLIQEDGRYTPPAYEDCLATVVFLVYPCIWDVIR